MFKKIAFAAASVAFAASAFSAGSVTGATGVPTAVANGQVIQLTAGTAIPDGAAINIPTGSSLSVQFPLNGATCSATIDSTGTVTASSPACQQALSQALQANITVAGAGAPGVGGFSTPTVVIAGLAGLAVLNEATKGKSSSPN